jgi:ATP-dependent protease HslVU (ClpYQ) peptidase subunit
VIDVNALKKGMPKAIKLEKDLADARSDASAFYKKFAKECGLNTAQLKKAAKAYADEDIEEAQRRKAEQMSLIFENCGA